MKTSLSIRAVYSPAFLLCLFLLFINVVSKAQSPADIDSSMNVGTGLTFMGNAGNVSSILVQPDGKIILSGNFDSYNGINRQNIVRINANGQIDSSFDAGTAAQGTIFKTLLQADGKPVLIRPYSPLRLNTNGSTDASFIQGTGAGNVAFTGGVQSGNKIIIGGAFLNFNGQPCQNIVRLLNDGNLDPAFTGETSAGLGAPYDGNVTMVRVLPDNKILISGIFTSCNGVTRNKIARLLADGETDLTFDPGSGAYASEAVLQPDGKIIIAGDFTSYNGIPINRIARLNSDGTLDTSFNPGLGADANVRALALQADGRIVIGGEFLNVGGVSRNHIARLEANGSLDTSFDPGTGTNGFVEEIAAQGNSRLLIGGNFSDYDGNSRNSILRVYSNAIVSAHEQIINQFTLFPNPTSSNFTIQLSEVAENADVEIFNLLGQLVLTRSFDSGINPEINMRSLSDGSYIVRVALADKIFTQKVILQR